MASNDPDFESKAADIIGLYLHPPQHAAVFCLDEKTAIQALDRLDPSLPEWDDEHAGELVDGCLLYDRRLIEDDEAAASRRRGRLNARRVTAAVEDPSAKELDLAEQTRGLWQEDRAELLSQGE